MTHLKNLDDFVFEEKVKYLGAILRPVVEVLPLNESLDTLDPETLRDRFLNVIQEHPEIIDEGFLSTLLGGGLGYTFGPWVGGVICKCLGVERGILYDMFTSRLVSTALGAALAQSLTAHQK